MPINQQLAYQLLAKYPVPDGVLEHIEEVKDKALRIGRQLKSKGQNIDLDFLEVAGILHDIGRHKINYQTTPKDKQSLHTSIGQEILERESLMEFSQIAGAHSVVQVDENEALEVGLTRATKLPNRVEAKIVCVADKLRGGPPEQAVEDWFEKTWDRYFKQRPDVGQRALDKTLEFVKELRELGWGGGY